MTVKIYHNPRCTKSRQALELLKSKNIDPEIILYLEKAPTVAEVTSLLKMLGLTAREVLRKKEAEYKELGLNDTTLSEKDIIDAITKAPKLLERPIVIKGNKAAIGRPTENILDIL